MYYVSPVTVLPANPMETGTATLGAILFVYVFSTAYGQTDRKISFVHDLSQLCLRSCSSLDLIWSAQGPYRMFCLKTRPISEIQYE